MASWLAAEKCKTEATSHLRQVSAVKGSPHGPRKVAKETVSVTLPCVKSTVCLPFFQSVHSLTLLRGPEQCLLPPGDSPRVSS